MSIEIIRATISEDCEREKFEVIAIVPFRLRTAVEQKVARMNGDAQEIKATYRFFTNITSISILTDEDEVASW